MPGKRQFTLALLFAETSLVAAAAGAIRLIVVLWGQDWAHTWLMFPLLLSVFVIVGAAIGGVFGKMAAGSWFGLAAFLFFLIFLAPRVR